MRKAILNDGHRLSALRAGEARVFWRLVRDAREAPPSLGERNAVLPPWAVRVGALHPGSLATVVLGGMIRMFFAGPPSGARALHAAYCPSGGLYVEPWSFSQKVLPITLSGRPPSRLCCV